MTGIAVVRPGRWSLVDLGGAEPHNPRDRRGPLRAPHGEGMGQTLPRHPRRRRGLVPLAAGWLSFALVAGCANDRPRPVQPADDLFDPNPTRRVQAVSDVRRTGATDHIPRLIELLDDEDETVRLMAGAALRDLTGRDTGYAPYADPAQRRAQVEDWRGWWAARRPGPTDPPARTVPK